MNECKICNRIFNYTRSKGGTKTKCNTCHVNERKFKLRIKIIKHLGGKCSSCGYDKCYGALDAHHLDASSKHFNISGAHSRSWKRIEEELNKCVLICANCHRTKHHRCKVYGC